MKEISAEHLQTAYVAVVKKLIVIGDTPEHVKHGFLGFFLSMENILQRLGSPDPNNWFKDVLYDGKPVSFTDLPLEDQEKIKNAMTTFLEPAVSQNHLEEKCWECYRLCMEMNDKILELTPRRRAEAEAITGS